jgi:hypothetical protein
MGKILIKDVFNNYLKADQLIDMNIQNADKTHNQCLRLCFYEIQLLP